MISYELWIDESGNFDDEYTSKYMQGSLVGGVLIKNESLTYDDATKILEKKRPRDTVHFVDEDPAKAVNVLKKCLNYDCKFVVFQNKDKHRVVTSDTTYLNVLAEGIVKLYVSLLSVSKNFEFNIFIANRKNTDTNHGIISDEEYILRLKERMTLEFLRKSIYRPENKRWIDEKNISFGDARYDSMLQLADCVCNTFLTKKSSKFNDEQKIEIEKAFNIENLRYFKVFKKSVKEDVEGLIANGNFGEAIFISYFNKDQDIIDSRNELINKIVAKLGDNYEIISDNALKQVLNHVDNLIRYNPSYGNIEETLKLIQDELCGELRKVERYNPSFELSIALYLYTIQTHSGEKEAEEQDEKCSDILKDIPDMFEKIIYYCKLMNRRSIHLKNMFDNEGSETAISNVIRINTEVEEAFSLVTDLEKVGLGKNIELGKAYGTRLQIWPVLWNEEHKEEYITNAQNDMNLAIENLPGNNFDRQYLYYAQMAVVTGRYEEAIEYLLKTENIEYKGADSIKEFLLIIKDKEFFKVIYQNLMYLKIMLYAKKDENPVADILSGLFEKYKHPSSLQAKKNPIELAYPMNMILWMYGQFIALVGRAGDARKFYTAALEDCWKADNIGLTIKLINIGIVSSLLLLQNGNNPKNVDAYNNLKNSILGELSDIGKEYWSCIEVDDYEKIIEKAMLIS